jgi:fructose-1,6-bisphosphatase/inositol monophosphatase family enzyme
MREALPEAVVRAGLGPAQLARLDHLVVGCGGFVKELITYTAGASHVKDRSGERLSAADVMVDELLRAPLLELVPGSGGYSEEGGWFGEPWGSAVRWLVDPVDGTRPATLGGAFGVSVAALVMEGGAPVAALGWVYVPTLSALYWGGVAGERRACLLNGEPVQVEAVAPAELPNRYLAVSSNWQSGWLSGGSLKLSAPGATSVHLTRLAQPGSDVAAAALTRYRAHDAAAGLAVALGGGAAIYRLDEGKTRPGERLEPMAFLQDAYARPEAEGRRILVCHPGVAESLRGGTDGGPAGLEAAAE